VLRGLGLLLARRTDERNQRDVHVADVLAPHVEAELPDGLEEREDLDIADGATDLGDDDIHGFARESSDTTLDLIGDVRDDLHGLSEVVPATFGGDDRGVDRAGRRVRVSTERLIDEPLVVPEIQISLATVIGDEDLAVLEGIHRPRIHVEIRVELLHRDAESTTLEQSAE
jgi:hypothetical protein